MDNPHSFVDKSYTLHQNHLANQDQQGKDPLERLKLKGSINYWRHERMYLPLLPLVNRNEKWITIGDGIGTDAHWLTEQGVDVLATDIGDAVLKKAFDEGFIKKYDQQNAEKIGFDANSFDYSLCKEAYHHFPRPYLAVYEMLRISRKGVILIEPQDPIMQVPLLLFIKNILYKFNPGLLSKIWKNQYSFEEVGNYVYKVSEREIEKIAMGIGLPAIAFKGINDYYDGSAQMNQIPPDAGYFNKVKRKISFRDRLCKWGIIPYRLLVCVIFKEGLNTEERKALEQAGYQYIQLPPNPYA